MKATALPLARSRQAFAVCNKPRHRFTRPVACLGAVMLLAASLSGCISSGASSFATGGTPADQTGSASPPPVLPLDVVGDTDESVATASVYPQGQYRDDDSPESQVATVQQGQDPLASQAADLQQALLPEEQSVAARGNARLAALAPPATLPEGAPMLSGLPGQMIVDPVEEAAEARIPDLYASFKHGQCEGGWGPKPKLLNARRITPGDPYYMEMRLRHTPLLPVGNVYIAYGRLGAVGEPIDEHLIMLAPVGGYGGAAFAAAVPMPGVLTPYGDDCVLRPVAAYRVSLSASRFEQLLLEIRKQKQKKPAYALFAYNCNHFMSDVAKAVGILPPENIYEPSLKYFYSMMDRNEGRPVPRNAAELAAEQQRLERERLAQERLMLAADGQPPVQ
ncbi:MAG: hypothetical protein VYD64_05645 [Pseudomonadota bacterium]|nr:hypothetical protein [Pseudomonadota bacterium]